MKKFNITVNGNVYEVEVEEVSVDTPAVQTPVVKAAPQPKAAAPTPVKEAPKAAPAASGTQGAIKATSPMPGTILKVNLQVGQKVSKGDAICILESMKMENEIPCPADGVVASVNMQNGMTVNAGDVLATIN
jgi:Biotin carboxyl carrier protein